MQAGRKPPAPDLEYLWQDRSDKEIASDLNTVLVDVNALTSECDALFDECIPEGIRNNEDAIITFGQLHAVTQRLIDRFGSRDPAVLAGIADLYRGFTLSGSHPTGIGLAQFRGYVASVLTHILRELEARAQAAPVGKARPAETAASGPGHDRPSASDPGHDRSIAEALSDMLVRAGSALF